MSEGISALLGGPQQMSLGERAALEGVLYAVKPQLAIEIGTAEGGSLKRIAEHSAEVHSFDLVEPDPQIAAVAHATFHSGDSHRLLPEFLAQLADEGRQADFVLVDGDHSADGVRRDAEDLLASPAIAKAVILFHDTANEEVRRGIDAVDFDAHEKVVHVEPDFVAGSLFSAPDLQGELWGGLGLVLVDAGSPRAGGTPAIQQRIVPTAKVLREARDRSVRSPADRVRAAVRARLQGR
jgi:hypothetical protein